VGRAGHLWKPEQGSYFFISSLEAVTTELANTLLLVVFLSLLPIPRFRLYIRAFVLAVGHFIGVLLFVGRWMRPLADLLKVDLQSKLLSGVIFISTSAPRIGDYILSHEFGFARIQRAFYERIGKDMRGFRRDMRRIYVDEFEVSDETPTKGELLADIKRTRTRIRRKHAVGQIVVGVCGSTLALLVGTISVLAGLAILLSVYLIVFPISMALRSVVVDTLAYSGELVNEDKEEITYHQRIATLGFKRGWNSMILDNEAIIHKLILVSFVKGELVLGYELGEEFIRKIIAGEMHMEEALDELVYDHLGEDTSEANLYRRALRWLFGV
jgi:hypothetical protein